MKKQPGTQPSALVAQIDAPSRQLVKKETSAAQRTLETYETLDVVDPSSYEKAGVWLREAKKRKAALEDALDRVLKPIREAKRAADRARKEATNLFNEPMSIYHRAILTLTGKLGDYDRQKEAEALEEQRRLEAAERKRIEARARRAEKKGDSDRAEEIRSEPPPEPPVVVPPPTPKIEGLSKRRSWKAAVPNSTDFAHAVLRGEIDLAYVHISPNMRALNELARQSEGKNPPPGVTFYEDIGFAKAGS
jgi:hypothetical protein